MSFDPTTVLTSIVKEVEGKIPTKIESYLDEEAKYLKENGITENMHVGNTNWTVKTASEWLLSQFIGIVNKGKEDKRIYNAFGSWLTHVYHFVIDNKPGLPLE